VIERSGYAYEAGRAKAAEDALKRLDKAGVIANASSLFRLAAAKVSPAVVNIRSFRAGKGKGDGPNAKGKLVPAGIGSGVVIDKARGLVVTNHHVIKEGEQFIVRPGRGGEWPATIVGVDANTDLAVLQVKAPLQVQAEWGDPDTMAVGEIGCSPSAARSCSTRA
jgi:serine protease Do